MVIVEIRALQAPKVASQLGFIGTRKQLRNWGGRGGIQTQSSKDSDLSLPRQEIVLSLSGQRHSLLLPLLLTFLLLPAHLSLFFSLPLAKLLLIKSSGLLCLLLPPI